MPELCFEYGQQLEFRGNNDDALSMFETAYSGRNDANIDQEEEDARRVLCLAGVARCTLRSGDLRKGLRLAREAG